MAGLAFKSISGRRKAAEARFQANQIEHEAADAEAATADCVNTPRPRETRGPKPSRFGVPP
jgi:hypothetical protein